MGADLVTKRKSNVEDNKFSIIIGSKEEKGKNVFV